MYFYFLIEPVSYLQLNEVLDGGDRPVFQVTDMEAPTVVFTSTENPTAVWIQILKV